MVVIFKILQVIIALSLLIIVHEFGHFLFAKLFHIRVEKFYLFFDVGGKALLRFKIGETEFGIGWLPFGGYCKISGMVDESMDLDVLKEEAKPWEFRSHNPWQRLCVMAGGVLFNFIFAIFAYSLISGIWGSAYISNADTEIYPNELAREMGFRPGDRILSLDDYVPEDFSMLQADLARRDVHCVSVLRGDDTLRLYMDQSKIGQVLSTQMMFDIALPFVIDTVTLESNAGRLRHGDRICAINGQKVEFLQDASVLLKEHASSEIAVSVLRDTALLSVNLQVDSLGRIGVALCPPIVKRQSYNFFESIPQGLKRTGETISGYWDDLRLVAKPSTGAYKSLGSFISIGQIFPDKWDWYQFLSIIALLSIMLGVMNLLPIPGLDGGHILITLYEIISGRKASTKFLVIAQSIGMILLLLLMILAFGNDITRLLR